MASDVEICNLALIKLGQNLITAFTDSTKEARTMFRLYPLMRDAELSANNWNFAVRRVSLAKLVETPVFQYKNLFQLPNDFLSMIMVGDFFPGLDATDYRSLPVADYQIENGKIATDLDSPLNVRYVAKVTDTSTFDSMFVVALAARLAMEACEILTQSNSKFQNLAQGYQWAINEAKANDAIQNPPEPLPDDTWIIARR